MPPRSRRPLLGILMVLLLSALAAPAWAAPEVRVSVDVVSGRKGGQGIDKQVQKHEATLSRIAGYGGWSLVQSVSMKVEIGKTEARDVGARKLSVSLESISADKIRSTLTVTDPGGKAHKVTSSMGRDGTAVLSAQSADGSEVHLFIATVDY